jgi:cytohesin
LSLHDRDIELTDAIENGYVDQVMWFLNERLDINRKEIESKYPLHLAAACGQYAITWLLIHKGFNVNQKGRRYPFETLEGEWTPLHSASNQGHEAIVSLLLKAGADPNATTEDRNTPLNLAAEGGHLLIVKELLQAGADPNATTEDRNTPLNLAAEGGHLLIVKELLQAGSEFKGSDYYNPFVGAVDKGHVEVVGHFLEALQISSTPSTSAVCKNTIRRSVNMAVIRNRHEILKLILEHDFRGSTQSLRDCFENPISVDTQSLLDKALKAKSEPIALLLLSSPILPQCSISNYAWQQASALGYAYLLDHFMRYDTTGLPSGLVGAARSGNLDVFYKLLPKASTIPKEAWVEAARQGHVEILHTLLQYRTVDETPSAARTGEHFQAAKTEFSHYLLFVASQAGRENIVELLLRYGANAKSELPSGDSSLVAAAEHGFNTIVQMLIFNDDFHACEMKDRALYEASKNGHDEIVQTLLKYGARVTYESDKGKTGYCPLSIAIRHGSMTTIFMILDTLDSQANKMKDEALYEASDTGLEEVVRRLLELGARPIWRSGQNGPLHVAARKGYAPVVQMLVQAGSDINERGSFDQTPLYMACEKMHVHCARILSHAGGIIAGSRPQGYAERLQWWLEEQTKSS